MSRARQLFGAALLSCLQGCGSSSTDEANNSYPPRKLVSAQACVFEYFDRAFGTTQLPGARWTIGVMDRPEIATAVTDTTGCIEVSLPARSRLLLTATKPGWVPNALTAVTGDVDLPSMRALFSDGFTGLPSWWWGATANAACQRPTPADAGGADALGDDTAIVAFNVKAHDFLGDPLPNLVPVLRPASGGERRDWLYAGAASSTYCNSPTTSQPPCPSCDCCSSSGTGIMPNVTPGPAEIEFQGLTCHVDLSKGAFAWPKAGAPGSVFELDVRAGYFTAVTAVCDPP